VLCGALGHALSASAPVFASGSPTGPARVRTTRLTTVVVHVHHAGSGRDLPGYLVDIVGRRDTGADIDDLPYPRLADQEPHGPLQERPVGRAVSRTSGAARSTCRAASGPRHSCPARPAGSRRFARWQWAVFGVIDCPKRSANSQQSGRCTKGLVVSSARVTSYGLTRSSPCRSRMESGIRMPFLQFESS
jgi:hypothetical protein